MKIFMLVDHKGPFYVTLLKLSALSERPLQKECAQDRLN